MNSTKIIFNIFILLNSLLYATNYSRTDNAIFEKIASSEEARKITAIFAKDCRGYTDYENFSGCLKPSFDCDKSKTNSELFICQSNPLAQIDNFFASYYKVVMKNIADEEKPRVIDIARKMLKARDEYAARIARTTSIENGQIYNRIESIKIIQQMNCVEYDPKLPYIPKGWTDDKEWDYYYEYEAAIAFAYKEGIQDLTEYLLEKNPNLFAKIFHKHTEEYRDILRKYDALGGISYLYLDNLIDETGKLIIKVDSQ